MQVLASIHLIEFILFVIPDNGLRPKLTLGACIEYRIKWQCIDIVHARVFVTQLINKLSTYLPYDIFTSPISGRSSSSVIFASRGINASRHATVPPCHHRRKAPVIEERNVIPAKSLERSHSFRVLLIGSFWSQLHI